MKIEKLTVLLSMVFLLFSISACGSVQADSSIKKSEEMTETLESSTEETGVSEDGAVAANKDLEETSASTSATGSTTTSSPAQNTVSSSTAVVETEPEPTPSPHVHQYVESITVQPTCAVAGEKTLACECGDVRTESVPATGSHNWVEQTVVVHHDELGHVEQSRVLTGYTSPHTEYECAYCGHREDSPAALADHRYNSGNFDHAFARTFAYDYPAEPIYETQSQWVVDQEAYDSVEVVGHYCSVCGLTNSTNTVEQTNAVE